MSATRRPRVGCEVKKYRFSVAIEKDDDGYFASCPELQGCYTQGDTFEEALENIHDAIRLHVQDRPEAGEELPLAESAGVTALEMFVDTTAPVKIVIEKHTDGYVGYPIGLKGAVVGQGDTFEEALADVKAAIESRIQTFGEEVLER